MLWNVADARNSFLSRHNRTRHLLCIFLSAAAHPVCLASFSRVATVLGFSERARTI